MKLRPHLALFLIAAIAGSSAAQTPAPQPPAPAATLPAFEAATIKPADSTKGGMMGFYSNPGGRVLMGFTSVKTLLFFAYDVKDFQIAGAPDWIGVDRYSIEAVPPDSSPSRSQKLARASPTDEQRQMLQSLLADRFKFQYHRESREGAVYILTRGSGKLELREPKDPDLDPHGGVTFKQGGIVDGEAFGASITMPFLASQLSRYLGLPVLDQTGIIGSWDYRLPPTDPENHDATAAIFDAMHRLGLNLKKGRGPIDTLVIDHIERPTAD